MWILLAVWALLSAAYLALVGQLTADEIGLALGCGLAASIWYAAIAGVAQFHFRFERAAVMAAIRAAAQLPWAVLQVAAALARGSHGMVIRQPFVHGREHDPAEAGRRAVSLLAVSLAPDKFALRLPDRRDAIDIHSIVAPPTAVDARWPT